MRPGWPTFNIQQALHKGDHAEWLLDLAQGTDAQNWIMNEVAVGVVMSIPDYPYSHLTRKEVNGVPLYGTSTALMPSLHLCEMQKGSAPHQINGKIADKECYVTAGDYVLVSSGTGDSVGSAKKKAYANLEKLSLPNSPMYRTDIGNRLKKQLPLLHSQGYATGMMF
jgi:phosphoribosylamine--glycine ligase